MKFKQANTYTIGYKVKEITHDLNHDLTFYCTHNQSCVPQYKVNNFANTKFFLDNCAMQIDSTPDKKIAYKNPKTVS